VSSVADPDHYQHTTRPNEAPAPTPRRWRQGEPLRLGDPVVITRRAPGDPLIFDMQQAGWIKRQHPDGGFMLVLWSAAGEWGPVEAERLEYDTDVPL
jgi:hypothetical protein